MAKKLIFAVFVEFESLISITEKAFKITLITTHGRQKNKEFILPKSQTVRIEPDGVWVTLWMLGKLGISLRSAKKVDFLSVRDKENKYFKRGKVEIVRYTPAPVAPVSNNTIAELKK